MKQIMAGRLAVWLALVVLFGADRSFVRPPGTPPFPIVIGATAPIITFLAAFRLFGAFRESILAMDLIPPDDTCQSANETTMSYSGLYCGA